MTRALDLTSELLLMTDDIARGRGKPVQRRFCQLLDALEAGRARYAICGAVAMGAHGAERYTRDIDVLIDAADLDGVVARLEKSMRELGREPSVGAAKQVRLRAKRAKSDLAVDIDLLVPVDVVEAWALATAVRARAFGRKVDVASCEALLVMKLRAYLSDPDSASGAKHRADAMTIGTTMKLDRESLRAFVRSQPDLAAELERVLSAPPPRGRLG